MYPWAYMYSRLGTPALKQQIFVTILSLVQFLQGVDGFESKTLALFAWTKRDSSTPGLNDKINCHDRQKLTWGTYLFHVCWKKNFITIKAICTARKTTPNLLQWPVAGQKNGLLFKAVAYIESILTSFSNVIAFQWQETQHQTKSWW